MTPCPGGMHTPKPFRIKQANRITWTELKRLLTNKYCPRTEVKKMEDEFYNLAVKGNDLKTYVRRFQELAVLCPNMVPNTKKLMEVFIGVLPRSIEGNVTASKPQTLEEAITITQRLMEQVTEHHTTQSDMDLKMAKLSRLEKEDKEVIKQLGGKYCSKEVMEVVARLLGDIRVRSWRCLGGSLV
ncbi:reverse transcriptase domain-containing protein [Tanacetum coccineum]